MLAIQLLISNGLSLSIEVFLWPQQNCFYFLLYRYSLSLYVGSWIFVVYVIIQLYYLSKFFFLLIHSDMIRLIVVWERPFLFSLYPHDQVRQGLNQSTLPMWFTGGCLDGWEAVMDASPFLHVTQMFKEPWKTKSIKHFGSVHFVCSIKSHILS